MAAGDTFRAAASDQLEIWAERTSCEIVSAEKEKAKASSGRQLNQMWNLHLNVMNSVFVLIMSNGESKSLINVMKFLKFLVWDEINCLTYKIVD